MHSECISCKQLQVWAFACQNCVFADFTCFLTKSAQSWTLHVKCRLNDKTTFWTSKHANRCLLHVNRQTHVKSWNLPFERAKWTNAHFLRFVVKKLIFREIPVKLQILLKLIKVFQTMNKRWLVIRNVQLPMIGANCRLEASNHTNSLKVQQKSSRYQLTFKCRMLKSQTNSSLQVLSQTDLVGSKSSKWAYNACLHAFRAFHAQTRENRQSPFKSSKGLQSRSLIKLEPKCMKSTNKFINLTFECKSMQKLSKWVWTSSLQIKELVWLKRLTMGWIYQRNVV